MLQEAKNLAEAGVKEILVISQDTSAYGVDLKYRTGFWGGRPVKTRLKELCEALAEFGIWVRLHYVYPYPSVDDLIPLMAEGKMLPYLDVPFQHASPRILKAMKRPASAENNLERIKAWRASARRSRSAPPSSPASRRDRRRIRGCSPSSKRRGSTASAASPIRRSRAPSPTICRAPCRKRSARSASAS